MSTRSGSAGIYWAQLGQEVQLRPYDAYIPFLKELRSDLLDTDRFNATSGWAESMIGDKFNVAVADAIGPSYINIVRLLIALSRKHRRLRASVHVPLETSQRSRDTVRRWRSNSTRV